MIATFDYYDTKSVALKGQKKSIHANPSLAVLCNDTLDQTIQCLLLAQRTSIIGRELNLTWTIWAGKSSDTSNFSGLRVVYRRATEQYDDKMMLVVEVE